GPLAGRRGTNRPGRSSPRRGAARRARVERPPRRSPAAQSRVTRSWRSGRSRPRRCRGRAPPPLASTDRSLRPAELELSPGGRPPAVSGEAEGIALAPSRPAVDQRVAAREGRDAGTVAVEDDLEVAGEGGLRVDRARDAPRDCV